jgi:hypothetical protein
VWEIVDITGMSKKDVLDQVYPDELEYIFRKKKDQEIQRLEKYKHTMIAIAAGFGSKTESGESLFKIYNEEITKAIDNLKNNSQDNRSEKEYTEEYINEQFEKLRMLQGKIASTGIRKGVKK